MAKDTLEKKIKRVCWWTLGLTILYFLLGAWLKSDGPNFDPGKTYELLKDTLTLTATFLAPVAAFVLFSDWRSQHVELKTERLSEEIWALNRRIVRKFYELLPALESTRTNLYKNEKNILKYDIDEAKAKLFMLGGHRHIGMDDYIKTGFNINDKMINIIEIFDKIVDKIDKSVQAKEQDFDNFEFDYCELIDDWIFDLLFEISDLDDLNHKLLKIGFTKKINS